MVAPNLSEIVSTTLRNRAGEFADNVTNKNALLRVLSERGKVRTLSGGRTIVRELDYQENSTFQFYSGYEALDVNAAETLSAAEFDWKQSAVNVTISGLEMSQNSGTEAVINLLESRITNAMRTMANETSTSIYSDGTGSSGKEIGGLQLLVADDPTTGTVGGINRANFDFWRNFSFDATTDGGAAASATNIQSYMNTVFNTVCRGSDFPDVIVADLNYFTFYQDSLQAQQRFADPEDLRSGDFRALSYGGNSQVLLDGGSGIPDDHMYFLNTDFLSFDVHEDRFFTPREAKTPINQDAMVIPVLFMGNLTMSNAERQGVLKD